MFRASPITGGRGELNFEELKFKISWLLKVLFFQRSIWYLRMFIQIFSEVDYFEVQIYGSQIHTSGTLGNCCAKWQLLELQISIKQNLFYLQL
jgi:hypothetical protein